MAEAATKGERPYRVGNHVGGAALIPDCDAQPVYNPATGEVQGEVVLSGPDEVDAAVKAARDAFPAWSETPPARRAKVLHDFRSLFERDADSLARTITAEHGKTVDDARGELARAQEVIEHCVGIATELKGVHSKGVARGVDTHTVLEPLGVCAGITPFNFPAMVPAWMFVPAIACGNTFVLKPSERDPSASLRLAALFEEAGLPPGVINVVQGGKDAVSAILAHPGIEAVSFVGSTPIAKHVYETGAAQGKRVQALGGAKNHMVILPDADIKQAADALMGAVYGSAGERCMAISVAVPVGEGTADALIEEIVPRVKALRIGPGDEEGCEMGPLITAEHRDRVASYVGRGADEGAEVVVDGREWSREGCEGGFFLGGSVLDRVRPGMGVHDDEIFGPVLSVVRAATAAEALEVVNGHRYANGAAVFTRDGMAARDFAERVDAGMVGINVPIPVPVGYHSFGGWKDSLFGSNPIYGPEGVRFYTRLKTVTTRWPGDERHGAEFTFPRTDG